MTCLTDAMRATPHLLRQVVGALAENLRGGSAALLAASDLTIFRAMELFQVRCL